MRQHITQSNLLNLSQISSSCSRLILNSIKGTVKIPTVSYDWCVGSHLDRPEGINHLHHRRKEIRRDLISLQQPWMHPCKVDVAVAGGYLRRMIANEQRQTRTRLNDCELSAK
ncbi:unnamed protein product [Albugo candida]|uniref:Uncharacterized protein n=1 Tax=Albugo candida TaxID=65357 RepID=A0A024GKR8_9STRA|nr:unnamed protein product [Albugo candida]|eukprot:CCI47461.1 unnamed protein product [Albugo candida]